MIITISGLDGAGKSTQIDQLTRKFSDDGFKVRYVWARGGYTPGFEINKKCLRSIFRKTLPPPGPSNLRNEKLKSPLIQRIWLIIAIADLIILWGIYVRILRAMKSVVICDRYLNDTLLDVRRNLVVCNIENGRIGKLLKVRSRDVGRWFLFWIPVELSVKRSLEKGEPFPDSPEVLSWRLNSYMDESLFPSTTYFRIDGRSGREEISNILYSKVNTNFQAG